jgi:hypothetical protein
VLDTEKAGRGGRDVFVEHGPPPGIVARRLRETIPPELEYAAIFSAEIRPSRDGLCARIERFEKGVAVKIEQCLGLGAIFQVLAGSIEERRAEDGERDDAGGSGGGDAGSRA